MLPRDTRIPRYYQEFEYMFVLAKGKPMLNPIREKCLWAGSNAQTYSRNQDGSMRFDRKEKTKGNKVNYTKMKGNVWDYCPAQNDHPAPFPEQLAKDHILSWSNEGDLVYDCFGGSGTTAKMAHEFNRNWILSEISSEYAALAQKRIDPYLRQMKLF